jgi:hypothetical protein
MKFIVFRDVIHVVYGGNYCFYRDSSNLKMEATYSSETMVHFYETTRFTSQTTIIFVLRLYTYFHAKSVYVGEKLRIQ